MCGLGIVGFRYLKGVIDFFLMFFFRLFLFLGGVFLGYFFVLFRRNVFFFLMVLEV